MARDFNPSNEPETCLYCGVKLRYAVYKGYKLKSTVSLCCQAPIDRQTVRRDTLAGWGTGTFCTGCKRELVGDAEDTELRVTEIPDRRSERPGYDGTFCTLDCGYRFGRLAAQKGVRYRRVNHDAR